MLNKSLECLEIKSNNVENGKKDPDVNKQYSFLISVDKNDHKQYNKQNNCV